MFAPSEATPAPAAPGIVIPLDRLLRDLDASEAVLRLLETSGDSGVAWIAARARHEGSIVVPDLDAARRLHAAVRSLVTNTELSFRTRAMALELIKAIEERTGLSPNQGLVSPETYALVAHAPTVSFAPARYSSLVRKPTVETSPRVREVLEVFGEVFPRAYASMWQQYELLDVGSQIAYAAGEQPSPETRHFWAMSEALWVLAEMLGKAGVEARVIQRDVFEPDQPRDYVIWFHDPSDPFVEEIELAPELFWADPEARVLATEGVLPRLERGISFFVNRAEKDEEGEWLDTFEEGIEPNPPVSCPVVLYHGTLRGRVPSIKRRGIDVGEGWGGAGTSGVFLSRTPEGALYWAKMAFLRDRGEKLEVARFDRKHGQRMSKLLSVLEVTIPASELGRLKVDMEQAEDVGFEGSEDDWRASLEQIGDVRFDGVVPPEWIRPLAP